MFIEDLELRKTCSACPEQYDVFKNNKKVAYLRLRHGVFRVDMPDCVAAGPPNVTVFETDEVCGDGEFHFIERNFWLNKAVKLINEHLTTS